MTQVLDLSYERAVLSVCSAISGTLPRVSRACAKVSLRSLADRIANYDVAVHLLDGKGIFFEELSDNNGFIVGVAESPYRSTRDGRRRTRCARRTPAAPCRG